MQEIKLFDTRKPYYKYSRIKTSAAVRTILLSLAAYNCQKGDYALPTLKKERELLLIQLAEHIPNVLSAF